MSGLAMKERKMGGWGREREKKEEERKKKKRRSRRSMGKQLCRLI